MNSDEFGDIQKEDPNIGLKIDKVGVKGVRRKISTKTPEGDFFYDVVLNAFVSLPRDTRGTHMSRDIEAFTEAIEEANEEGSSSLEEVLRDMSDRLMEKHTYATKVELIAKTQHQYEESFTGPATNEMANVTISMRENRNGDNRRSVKVEVPGISVCPCAQQTFSCMEDTKAETTPSHTQRVNLSIKVNTREKLVKMGWLIDAARKSFSAPISSLLKREDEYELMKEAYKKPRFVEDLVRYAVYHCYKILDKEDYPEDTEIEVEAESLESIHPHNAYASRKASLEEIKKEEKSFEN